MQAHRLRGLGGRAVVGEERLQRREQIGVVLGVVAASEEIVLLAKLLELVADPGAGRRSAAGRSPPGPASRSAGRQLDQQLGLAQRLVQCRGIAPGRDSATSPAGRSAAASRPAPPRRVRGERHQAEHAARRRDRRAAASTGRQRGRARHRRPCAQIATAPAPRSMSEPARVGEKRLDIGRRPGAERLQQRASRVPRSPSWASRISAVTAAAAAAASSQARRSARVRRPGAAPSAATTPDDLPADPHRRPESAITSGGRGLLAPAISALLVDDQTQVAGAPRRPGHDRLAQRGDRDRDRAAERLGGGAGDRWRSSPATAPETIVSGVDRGAVGSAPRSSAELSGCSQARRGALHRGCAWTRRSSPSVAHAVVGAACPAVGEPGNCRSGIRATARRTGTPRGRARPCRRSPCSPRTCAAG